MSVKVFWFEGKRVFLLCRQIISAGSYFNPYGPHARLFSALPGQSWGSDRGY